MKKRGAIKLVFLTVIIFSSFLPLVLAQDSVPSNALTKFLDEYIAPPFNTGTYGGWIIGIIAAIIIVVIILDICQLILPFSEWVNWVIAGGFGIVAVILGTTKYIAGIALSTGAALFGGAASLSLIMVGVMGMLAIGALFFGGNKIIGWLKSIKENRKNLEKNLKAQEAGGDAAAAANMGKSLGKFLKR